jgi:hypothetical protein
VKKFPKFATHLFWAKLMQNFYHGEKKTKIWDTFDIFTLIDTIKVFSKLFSAFFTTVLQKVTFYLRTNVMAFFCLKTQLPLEKTQLSLEKTQLSLEKT